MSMTGDWDKLNRDMQTLPVRLQRRMSMILGKNAVQYCKIWKEGIVRKQFGLQANAPLTTMSKGSTTPLVNHGDLVNEIKPYALQTEPIRWFCGILKNARQKNGQDLVNIANVLEYGTQKPIKPKGHPFLAIPVTKEAQRTKGAKNFPRELTFFKTARGGVLVEVKEKVYKIHFILLPSVNIPARPAMRKAQTIFEKIALHNISEGVKKELKKNAR